MSEEEVVVETKPRRTRAPKKAESFRIVCTPRVVGYLHDPDRNVRVPANGQNPVEVSGPVNPGSWLECQINAGLIKVIE